MKTVLPAMSMARSSQTSVNLRRALQRLFQLLEREVLAARDLQDWGLAAAAEFGGVGQLGSEIMRDHDRAVTVGVDQIVGAYGHAGDTHLAAEAFGMHPGMRRADRAGQRLEARRPLRDVADRAV